MRCTQLPSTLPGWLPPGRCLNVLKLPFSWTTCRQDVAEYYMAANLALCILRCSYFMRSDTGLVICKPGEVLLNFVVLYSIRWGPGAVEMGLRPFLPTSRRPRPLLGFTSSLVNVLSPTSVATVGSSISSCFLLLFPCTLLYFWTAQSGKVLRFVQSAYQ